MLTLNLSHNSNHSKPTGYWAWILLVAGLTASASIAVHGENPDLSRQFIEYESELDNYIKFFTNNDWSKAHSSAQTLSEYSQRLHSSGKSVNNEVWIYYASNLVHHCQELILPAVVILLLILLTLSLHRLHHLHWMVLIKQAIQLLLELISVNQ